MAKFMYLFRSNPAAYQSMSPEQMQQTMKKWMDWKDTLEKNGHVKQFGERLDGTGKAGTSTSRPNRAAINSTVQRRSSGNRAASIGTTFRAARRSIRI